MSTISALPLVAADREALQAVVLDGGLAAVEPDRPRLVVLLVAHDDAIGPLHDLHVVRIVLKGRRRRRHAVVLRRDRFVEDLHVGQPALVEHREVGLGPREVFAVHRARAGCRRSRSPRCRETGSPLVRSGRRPTTLPGAQPPQANRSSSSCPASPDQDEGIIRRAESAYASWSSAAGRAFPVDSAPGGSRNGSTGMRS